MLVILLSKFNRFYLFTHTTYYYYQVNVPAVCYAREAGDNDSNNILMNDDETDHPHTSHLSCLHGQKYYQHGAQWTSSVDECFMCNCHYGRVICDLIICPVVQCPVPSAKPGMCCPTCEGKYKILESEIETMSAQTFLRGLIKIILSEIVGTRFQLKVLSHPHVLSSFYINNLKYL